MKNLNKLHVPIGIILLILILSSCSTSKVSTTSPKPLIAGWYSYKQITKAGYQCEPFKGRHYLRPTSDSARVNITPIK